MASTHVSISRWGIKGFEIPGSVQMETLCKGLKSCLRVGSVVLGHQSQRRHVLNSKPVQFGRWTFIWDWAQHQDRKQQTGAEEPRQES